MKILLSILAVTLIAPLTAIASGQAGGGKVTQGAGTLIEATFRTEGYGLIARIAANTAANSLCDATTLQSALDSSDVRVVDTLTLPPGAKPDPQERDAWSRKDDIQLLYSSWKDFVDINMLTSDRNRSVGALIIHEIYRATGTCNDDHFVITDRVFQLINGGDVVRKNFSESWSFTDAYLTIYDVDLNQDVLVPVGDAYDGHELFLCDHAVTLREQGTCLELLSRTAYIEKNAHFMPTNSTVKGAVGIFSGTNVETVSAARVISGDFSNQVRFVSPEHPYVVVHNIRSGSWVGGIQ